VEENLPAVKEGSCNLVKHLENVSFFGVPAVVAINRFTQDTEKEVEFLKEIALDAGASAVAVSEVWAKGGEGGIELAEAVVQAAEKPGEFKFLYPLNWSIKKKIETIATKIYGADGVEYDDLASRKIRQFTRLGFDKLPICMAKTHLSLSHDPTLKGRPKFTLPIRDIRASVGAGFLYPLCGEMKTMPGLPSEPAFTRVDIDEEGRTLGLF
jgi:formyltetrahydrofolate synthetase